MFPESRARVRMSVRLVNLIFLTRLENVLSSRVVDVGVSFLWLVGWPILLVSVGFDSVCDWFSF